MPHFFATLADVDGDRITLRGDNAHHIAFALRMAAGEHITVSCGTRFLDCELTSFSPDKSRPWVEAHICGERPMDTEPPYRAVLYQALPKGDKLDTIIQKAVECGASAVIPFESSRCVVRVKPEAEERKTERRRRISEEAAKQCGRGIIPEVYPTLSYEAMLQQAAKSDLVLFCYEAEGTVSLRSLLTEKMPAVSCETPPTIAVIVGSEGGFSPEEADAARNLDFCMVGLGKRILRCETAPSFVLACLSYQFEL